MRNAKGIPKSEVRTERNGFGPAGSDFEHSGFFRHSSFVIRHSDILAGQQIPSLTNFRAPEIKNVKR